MKKSILTNMGMSTVLAPMTTVVSCGTADTQLDNTCDGCGKTSAKLHNDNRGNGPIRVCDRCRGND